MYPKTERALRFSFGFIGSLYGLIFLGKVAQIALVFIENPNSRLANFSGMFVSYTLFILLVALSYGYVVVRFHHLLAKCPHVMAWTLHFGFFGQAGLLTVQYILGARHFNQLGAIIATAVYASLLIGVKKLTAEQSTEGAS